MNWFLLARQAQIMPAHWSPQQYFVFEGERTRPVRDLLNAIPTTNVRAVLDLGCGPGNSTEVLATRFPNATITGLDSSPEMVEAARKRLPGIEFELAELENWDNPGPFDVILANAVFQWVPNHTGLFPRLVAKLAPNGSLAVQMPDNLDEPAHQLIRETAASGPWADKLADATKARTLVESPGWYYNLLQAHSQRVELWRTTYYHALSGGVDAVVEWFKGSGLRPFLTRLSELEQAAFLDRYRAALATVYTPLPNGIVLLPFPRLFIVATRR
jgi:trans-aconitate 2-methyltransferase